MGKPAWFAAGIFSVAAIGAIIAYAALRQAHGFSALEAPSAVERWIATTARNLSTPDAAMRTVNPVPDTPEVLAEGRAHWADHCASCHANNGSGDTELGKHLYPPAPDMRTATTQSKPDGQLFAIIQKGIRMSGMPGWGADGHEEASWQLVRFIRHLPHLTEQEELDMRKLNPKSPDEIEEEQEENTFLNGAAPNEHKYHDH
jgi:mono/diheme cytochrome c family protein